MKKNKVVVVVVIIAVFYAWNALFILSLYMYLLFLTQMLLKHTYVAIECESLVQVAKIQKAKSRRATWD